MPLISEAASAIKSRFGFQDRTSASESVSIVPSSPDLSKSVSRETAASSALSLVPASAAVPSVGEREDVDASGTGSVLPQVQGFDFSEDPSFWKDHNVQVIIRVRPLSSMEISQQGHSKCIRQDSCQSIAWTGHPESRFTFDLVADESVSQEKLFKVAGVPMVDNCVGGYNSCMFAYGQTGSGKTHTMLGDIEGGTRRHSVNCGMTPRVFEYLFSRIQKEKEARQEEKLKFTCRCSFLEIYNEQIFDLLDPSSNNLQIREDVKKGVYVENLKEIEVASARDVIQQLIQGASNRKVAATNMNRASSRSHSVFTCIIESKWESQGIIHHRFARLNLVDLAGSERQKSSGAEGERLKEATNINKSLSTLGLVIMNLVSISNGKSLHVPYRDSKLTFLLQDSLGGNSKTIIISNVSPSLCCSLETLSTLKFAQRAKFIKNNAIVNEDTSGDVIAMRMQIQQLKKEVSRLRSLVNGGSENLEHDVLSLPGSPSSFKWEGLQGSFSPLVSEKRMSQKKDYEVALVGAFRRERDKDIALKASAAENQAALQLAKQREDEIKGLKMVLRFRESGIKRLEAVASGKISAETHLLKEKEEHLKEIEVLRTQVDRNHEATRFAMENLRLKEEIRRLKSFYEEGEREIMNDQIMALQNKLLEALDWKLMHESDSLTVQKGNSCVDTEAPGDLSIHSIQEPGSSWNSGVNEENEFLRMQAIQNQAEIDTLHKQLDFFIAEKEKLERDVNDLLAKLEEERLFRVTKEGTQQIELSSAPTDSGVINIDNQMELKTMVDAIAAASQREAEAHKKAIILTKENDKLELKLDAVIKANNELETKLKALIDEKNSLIEMYERAADKGYKNMNDTMRSVQHEKEVLENGGDAESLRETEMKTVIKNLEHQLMEMYEENEKLINLYEKAMHERDEFKRIVSSGKQNRVEFRELDCPEKLVEVDGGDCFNSCVPPPVSFDAVCTMEENDVFGLNAKDRDNVEVKATTISAEMEERMNVQDGARHCLLHTELRENMVDPHGNKLLKSAEPPNVAEANMPVESVGISAASNKADVENAWHGDHQLDAGSHHFETFSDMETEPSCLDLVRMKLDSAQEKLLDSAKALTACGVLEKAFIEFGEVSREIKALEEELQVKQEELGTLELVSSEMRERKDVIDKKLSALKYCFSSFSSSVAFFEQREARANARLSSSLSYMGQKKEELVGLQSCKDELESALGKIQQSEAELRNNMTFLKSKLEEENRRQENEKVLFAIDNVEKVDPSQQNWYAGSKATDLLKSAEEKNKLQTDLKLSRKKLGIMRKEFEVTNKKLVRTKSEIQAVELEIQKGSSSVEEMELALKGVIQEKESLLEIRKNGMSEIQCMVGDYCQHVFDTDLKEGEIEILKEELMCELNRIEELRKLRVATAEKLTKLLDDTRLNSCSLSRQMEEELHSIRASVFEAKVLVGKSN